MKLSNYYLYKGKFRFRLAKKIGQEKYATMKHHYAGKKC